MGIIILTHDTRWKGLGPTAKRAVEAALKEIPPPVGRRLGGGLPQRAVQALAPLPTSPRWEEEFSITLVLTNNAEIKKLNHLYRGKNKATNVLSFSNGEGHLGDIVLAYETIAAEAKAQGKSLKHHLTHLTIHGVLHLLGLDHETDKDARIMERCEIAILARMGIANPYETA